MNALTDNYVALAYTILTKTSTDKALLKFNLLDVNIKPKDLRKMETEDMQRLYEEHGMTYKQIGDFFGISEATVWRKIYYLKSKSGKKLC